MLMVLAAGVSAFHTSTAAGLCWQQLLSPSNLPALLGCCPACGDDQATSSLPRVVMGSLGELVLPEYGGLQSFILEGFLLYPLHHCAAVQRECCCNTSKKHHPPLSLLSPPSHLFLSLLFSPPSRGQKSVGHSWGAFTGNQAPMLRSAPRAGWSWWDGAMGWGLPTDLADTHPTGIQPWGPPAAKGVLQPQRGLPLHPHATSPPTTITHSIQALLSSG